MQIFNITNIIKRKRPSLEKSKSSLNLACRTGLQSTRRLTYPNRKRVTVSTGTDKMSAFGRVPEQATCEAGR
jgi:hypothetical protein